MRKRLRCVLLALLVVLSTPSAAAGASTARLVPPPCAEPPCFSGDEDAFIGGDQGGRGDRQVTGRLSAPLSTGVRRPASPFRGETRYVPTCDGNNVDSGMDVICGAAVNSCPVPSEVRFWVYTRQVDTRIPGDDPPFERVSKPPYICRDLTAPEIDPAVAIAGIVNRDFQRVVALKGVPEISPEPDTLVNIDTIFTTSSPNSYDIPLTVLGRSVVITATASRWTWHFGDGATGSTAVAGSKGRVLHTYRQSGSRGAFVIIEWTGTFRVGGGPVQSVTGTATTTGDPVTIAVKQARTELVGG